MSLRRALLNTVVLISDLKLGSYGGRQSRDVFLWVKLPGLLNQKNGPLRLC